MNKLFLVSRRAALMFLPLFIFLFVGSSAHAGATDCKMNFTMKSWSFFYNSGKGEGTITCDNGQKARVRLRAHGGGLSFGKNKTLNGQGTFSKTSDVSLLLGSYAAAEVHGGAGDSGAARVLTKGNVSLALSGSGKGVNVGFDFGSFKISKK